MPTKQLSLSDYRALDPMGLTDLAPVILQGGTPEYLPNEEAAELLFRLSSHREPVEEVTRLMADRASLPVPSLEERRKQCREIEARVADARSRYQISLDNTKASAEPRRPFPYAGEMAPLPEDLEATPSLSEEIPDDLRLSDDEGPGDQGSAFVSFGPPAPEMFQEILNDPDYVSVQQLASSWDELDYSEEVARLEEALQALSEMPAPSLEERLGNGTPPETFHIKDCQGRTASAKLVQPIDVEVLHCSGEFSQKVQMTDSELSDLQTCWQSPPLQKRFTKAERQEVGLSPRRAFRPSVVTHSTKGQPESTVIQPVARVTTPATTRTVFTDLDMLDRALEKIAP